MVLARLWEVMQTTTRDSVAQFLLLSSLVALLLCGCCSFHE